MTRTTAARVAEHTALASTLVALAVALLSTAGCGLFGGAADVKAPTTPAGITGQITRLDESQQRGVVCTMLVEGDEQPAGAVSDKAMVTVSDETSVARGDRWVPAQDLAVGMTVRVWFEGAVAESYPVQGTASFIEIQ
jgi:hypothetical protein